MSTANGRPQRLSLGVAALGGILFGALLALLVLRATSDAVKAEPPQPDRRPPAKAPNPPVCLTVVTSCPGTHPDDVVGLLTRPLERSLGGLPAVAASASKSIEGVSLV